MSNVRIRIVMLVVLAVVAAAVVVGGATAVANASEGETETEDHANETEVANFEITNLETNGPIAGGETAEVTVEVTNVGGETAEKEVWFSLDTYHKDDASVELKPEESATVSLEYVSQRNDDREWTLTAETPDDVSTTAFEIQAPDREQRRSGGGTVQSGVFEITDVEANDPIKANETLELSVEVTNTGDLTTRKRVWFRFGGTSVNETVLEVWPGESETVNLSYDTGIDDHGTHNITAFTPNDESEIAVEIDELVGVFEITGVETNAPLETGETLVVSAEVTNTGDVADETSVWLQFDDFMLDRRIVEIPRNESATVELRFHNVDAGFGEWNHSVHTADDSEPFSAGIQEQESRAETTATAETIGDSNPSESATTESAPAESTESDSSEAETGTERPEIPVPEAAIAAAVAALVATALVVGRRG